jgi:hypothetical protein
VKNLLFSWILVWLFKTFIYQVFILESYSFLNLIIIETIIHKEFTICTNPTYWITLQSVCLGTYTLGVSVTKRFISEKISTYSWTQCTFRQNRDGKRNACLCTCIFKSMHCLMGLWLIWMIPSGTGSLSTIYTRTSRHSRFRCPTCNIFPSLYMHAFAYFYVCQCPDFIITEEWVVD